MSASEKEISDSANNATVKTAKKEVCKETELDENQKYVDWVKNNIAKLSDKKFDRIDVNTVSCCANYRVDLWTKIPDKIPDAFSVVQEHLELTDSYFVFVKKSGSKFTLVNQSEWSKEKFSKQA